MDDLDLESLRGYRQMLQNHKPTHPYNSDDDQEFLRRIGGWKKNRKTGEEGLTLAGLLMFGQLSSLQEALPHYLLAYQERPEKKTEVRWVDRITLDGTWSGNLFDFYRKVINKLTADLKVPFRLKGSQRQDQTPVHEALREALVNTLVHADYSGRMSVQIIKRQDAFSFRNPGLMRIPVEQAIQGGESDCRNRTIHQMFLLIGLGERAGSGIPKIYSSWASQHWRQPLLIEKVESEQTKLQLRMIDLLPSNTLAELSVRFGVGFTRMAYLERLILATALIEEAVNHIRIREITTEHSSDISRTLHRLVKDGFLITSGNGRGTFYYIPDIFCIDSDGLTPDSDGLAPDSDGLTSDSDGLASDSDGLTPNSDGLAPDSDVLAEEQLSNRHQDGRLIVTSLEGIDHKLHDRLLLLTEVSRRRKKLPTQEMEKIIQAACQECYLSLRVLAELLDRSSDFLRQNYLNKMVKGGKLRRAFPREPNSPKQAYTSAPCAAE